MSNTVNPALAGVSTAELLEELSARGSLKPVESKLTVDGRALRKLREDEHANEKNIMLGLELRALELAAAGMAAAQPSDRVHEFYEEDAPNSLPPGSLVVGVRLLALPIHHPTIIEEDELKTRPYLN